MYYTVYNIQYSKWYLESKYLHECEPHKRKIDIEKIQYKNSLDSLQTNCVVMNLLFTVYMKRYKAIS